jgi:hypothetical protein
MSKLFHITVPHSIAHVRQLMITPKTLNTSIYWLWQGGKIQEKARKGSAFGWGARGRGFESRRPDF